MVAYYAKFIEDPMTNPMELRLRMHQLMRVPEPQKLITQPPPPQLTPAEQAKTHVDLERNKTKAALDQSVIAKNYAQAMQFLQQVVNNAQAMAAQLQQFEAGADQLNPSLATTAGDQQGKQGAQPNGNGEVQPGDAGANQGMEQKPGNSGARGPTSASFRGLGQQMGPGQLPNGAGTSNGAGAGEGTQPSSGSVQ
jgi:hypothetical protein